MKTTSWLFIATLSISFLIYSCQKEANSSNTSNGPRSVRIYLTDHQTIVFDSVFIDLQKLEVKMEDDTSGHDGWVNLTINPGVYNILRLRNGIDTLFATGNLPNARLRKIRLTLGTRNTAMRNGQTFPLSLHDDDRQIEAKLETENFEITPSGEILFWIDFDAGRSIEVDNSGSGNNNGYRLRSHLRIFTQSNTGRIEGKVLPIAASPVVMAINLTDTITAIPDNEGKFKIVGLSPATYRIFIDGHNGYNDTLISNVMVRPGEETDLPTIILRQ